MESLPQPPRTLSSLPQFSAVSQARLSSLYADFAHQKQSNPPGFQANLAWWRGLLEAGAERGLLPSSSSLRGGSLVLDVGDELVNSLKQGGPGVSSSGGGGGARPAGLAVVVSEMTASGALIPLKAFQESPTSVYATASTASWLVSNLVGKPLWWGLQQLSIVSSETGTPASAKESSKRWEKAKGRYVMRAPLEKAASRLIAHFQTLPHTSVADVLFSPKSFREAFASKCLDGVVLNDDEMEVMLRFLERDKRVLVRDGNVIKFDPAASSVPIITSVDTGVLSMLETVSKLSSQIADLESKIADRTTKVTDHLKRNQKDLAKSYLRSRRALEELLHKRVDSLATIQTVLLKIETAAGDIEILNAYETSTSTLKSLLATPQLQRDHVEATMSGMADVLADQAEIEDVMRSGGEGARNAAAGGVTIDEDELEKEFEELERAERERERFEKEERERREKQERERAAAAAAERERLERAERENAEKERAEREQAERERAEKEKKRLEEEKAEEAEKRAKMEVEEREMRAAEERSKQPEPVEPDRERERVLNE